MRKLQNVQRSLFSQWPTHRFSKELKNIDKILSDLPELVHWVADDLSIGLKKNTGAHGMTAEQVLRAAILKQQNQWSFEFLALQCIDSEMTKAFLKLNYEETYTKSCLQANISKIKASTWKRINDHIIQHAADLKIESGRTVRMDATTVSSNIHPPSDSSLLYDCIRVINDCFKKVRKNTKKPLYCSVSTKEAKALKLGIMNAKDGKDRKEKYKKLLRLSRIALVDLSSYLRMLEKATLNKKIKREINMLQKVEELLPLIMNQARRRVIKGESVPSDEKIVSIFEEHTDIIVKGNREVEYGHKVFLTAGKSGLVTDCMLVQGNQHDAPYFLDLVDRQKELYGQVPRQTSADGGFASEENVYEAKEAGVKDVCFSKRCGLEIEDMVKSPWVFQKLRNFRAGIESVISYLKRCFGFRKAMWKGASGFASFVHSSVVSYNLTLFSRLI